MSTTNSNAKTSQTKGLDVKAEGVVDQARQFGREVKDQASELTQSAAEAMKTQAGNLQETAKEVASDAGEKLRATVIEQKAAGADYVGNLARIIRRTALEFDGEIPQAGHYIRKTAAQLENVSEAVRNQNVSEIVGNVQDFARKQPTAFFGAAVLLGFAAVRFMKSGSSGTPASSQSVSNVGGTTAGM